MNQTQILNNNQKKVSRKGTPGMLIIILIGMIVTMINQSALNTMLPSIMTQLNIAASTAQWLITAYMLVMGILVPISAYFVQKFSYKQLFVTAMAFFALGALVCARSTGFEVLLVGRIIQSIGGGIIMPLSMNIFLAAFPVEKRGSAMGLLGLGMILAPALGPTLGGYVAEYYHWSVLFYGMAAIGSGVIITTFLFFNLEREKGNVKLDVGGTVLSSIGFGTLLYSVSTISSKGWSDPQVITFFLVAVISLTVFVFFELKKEDPLLEIRIFKDFNFSYTIIVNIVLQVALFGGMLLLPVYLQNIRGFTPLDSGFLLLPGTILMGLMGVFTGKLYDKVGIKPLAIVGLTIITGVTYMLSTLSLDTSYKEIMILYTIRCFGMSFVMMPITSAGLVTIPAKLMPHANALSNTLRQVAASIGSAALVVVMADQTKKHIADLGVAVTADATKLAALHGINVAFFVATVICAIALALSFFFTKPKDLQNYAAKESCRS